MYMLIRAVWFAIALASITIITKIARGRIIFAPVQNRLPPVVNGGSFIATVHMFVTKGLRAAIRDKYVKLGSVFTISFLGQNITFLVGPEVSGHFYQGLDSEIGHGDILEFTVPMIGKEVGHGIDTATRNEQHRFFSDALKPQKMRSHVGPMIQEVEGYFAKWGQQGMVDLKEELDQLLMLISGRCLIGWEVREKMFSEFFALFRELVDNGMRLINVLFPYAPTPANRRRDVARAKVSKIFSEIVRSRKRSSIVEEDVLHI
ncbi:hypothetical protein ACP70R_008299 [Stipagrostis hirtigluma subsp. patula]